MRMTVNKKKRKQASNTDSRQLNREMREQDLFYALPLLFGRMNFVRLQFPFLKVRYCVYDNPRYTAAKVDDLERGEKMRTTNQPPDNIHTSCIKKAIKPVAMIGFPIQT